MNDQQARWQNILFTLQSIATAAGVVKLVDDLMRQQISWLLVALFVVLLILQAAAYFVRGRKKYHDLEEGTAKFADFFAKWYSQSGHHTVYCDDLEWLEGIQQAPIVEALVRRKNAVEVFVREDDSPVCARLRQEGIPVRMIPVNTRTRTSMSLHSAEGHETLIYRSKSIKRGERHTIGFIETDAKYYTDMALDLFDMLRGVDSRADRRDERAGEGAP